MQGFQGLLRTVRRGCFVLLALLAVQLPVQAQDQTLPGEIRVGIPKTYLPITGVNIVGEASGLAIDLWRLWSEKTRVPVTFVAASFGETLSMLRHDKIDVHAAMFRNSTREAWLDFTRPFHESTSGFYTLRSRKAFASIDALTGKSVGVIRQSQQEDFLRYGGHTYHVKTFSGATEMLRALVSEEVDALLHEDEAMDSLLRGAGVRGDVLRLPGDFLRSPIYSAFKQNRPDLRNLVDWGFEQISRNEFAEIEKRWIDNENNRLSKPKGTFLALNEFEQAFLTKNKAIRIGMINDWPPMNSVNADGKPVGMSAAVAKLINERLGGNLIFVPGKWNDLLEDVKAKRLDAVFDISITKDRIPHFKFTDPYLEIPYAIVTQDEGDGSPLTRDGVKVAIERGYATVDFIREAYPGAELHEFESTREALGSVAAGDADVYVGNGAAVRFMIAQNTEQLGELKFAGELENYKSSLRVGVRHDWQILRGIFNKAIMGITPAQMKNITDPWLGGESEGAIHLSAEERFWLSEHKGRPVKVLIEDWPPFNYEDNGKYTGMAVDYVRYALGVLGLEPEFVRLPWSEALESIRKTEKIDLIPAMSPSPDRASFLAFTSPYLSFPTVIFTRDDARIVSGLADLAGMTVAVEKGFVIETRLKQDYPGIQLMHVDTTEQAVEAVSTGQADAYVGNLASGTYFIQHRGLSNVKVAAPFHDTLGENAMGVRRDWPELASMLNKALVNMPVDAHTKIRSSALTVHYETGIDLKELMKYMVPAGIAVLVIIGVFVFANRKLAGEVAERKKAEEKLKERESWFRSLLESAPDATLIVDPKGSIIRVNRQAEILFGYNREALLGQLIEILVPDDIKRKHVAYRDGFITSSAPRAMGASLKLMAKRHNGTEFPVEISLSPIETADGTLISASVRDVTDRRAQEAKLQEKDMQLTNALENMSGGMFMIDKDLRIQVFNRKFQEQYHIPNLTVGTPLQDLIMIRAGRGDYGEGATAQLVEERIAMYRAMQAARTEDIVPGGRIFEGYRQPTEDGGMVCVFNDITERKEAERRLAEQTERLQSLSKKLSRYLSPQIYDAIFSGASDADVRTERKKLTVFFSDIKNFTATTEGMEPEDMTFILNDYLTKMTEVALEHGGTIDKYIGDAIMVFFGDPETKGVKQDALAAVKMAVAMQRRMVDLRAKWSDMGFRHPFHIRCGVNTGYCNVGNFGSEQRIDYTIIGGQVNLAARLEGICEPDGVTIAYETYSLIRDEFEAEELEPIQVKGIHEAVTPYAIKGIFEQWDETERYIRRDDVRGLRLWVDLKRQTEEQRLASIRELEEAIEILKNKKADTAAE